MEILSHKDFTGSYMYVKEEGILFGKIEGIEDLVTFEAKNPEEIEVAFIEAVEDYILLCKEVGKEIVSKKEKEEFERFLGISDDEYTEKINDLEECIKKEPVRFIDGFSAEKLRNLDRPKLEYKGYSGTIEFSKADGCYFGQVLDLDRSLISYEGSTLEELEKSFKYMIDAHIEDLKNE